MDVSGETTASIISRGIGKRKEKGMADVFEKAKAEEKKPAKKAKTKEETADAEEKKPAKKPAARKKTDK